MEDFLVLLQEVVRCECFGVDALSRFVWRRLPVFLKGEKVEFLRMSRVMSDDRVLVSR
jgi:hypothetical protein